MKDRIDRLDAEFYSIMEVFQKKGIPLEYRENTCEVFDRVIETLYLMEEQKYVEN